MLNDRILYIHKSATTYNIDAKLISSIIYELREREFERDGDFNNLIDLIISDPHSLYVLALLAWETKIDLFIEVINQNPTFLDKIWDFPLGIACIKPAIAAMILFPIECPWKDLPENINDRDSVKAEIERDY